MKNRIGSLVLSATLAGLMTFFIAGCDKPQSTTGLPPPGTTVGTEIDDTVITTGVKSALLANPEIKSFDLKVETRKGEVQLSGFVDSQAQIDQASTIARGIAGVKSIQNNVSIKGTARTVGNVVDDSILTATIKAALLKDESIKSHDIAVITRKGEVQLSGFVDNQQQVDRAIAVASGVEGVAAVNNEMSIKK